MCITLNFLGCGSEEAYWHNRGLEPYRRERERYRDRERERDLKYKT